MKALSVRQPWAWLIVNGYKDIENRGWPSRYTGQLLIHAAKGMTREEYDDVAELLADVPPFDRMGIQLPAFHELERGGIVGVVHMDGAVERSDSPWYFGRHGFVLRDQKPLSFIPFRGQLGFFDVPDHLVQP